jgi:hypothetical protein
VDELILLHHSAASLVNTFVNYAVSLGLGFAGTVETQLNRGGKTKVDILHGYRSAFYLGIGFSGLGICVALLNLALDHHDRNRMKENPGSEQGEKHRPNPECEQQNSTTEIEAGTSIEQDNTMLPPPDRQHSEGSLGVTTRDTSN